MDLAPNANGFVPFILEWDCERVCMWEWTGDVEVADTSERDANAEAAECITLQLREEVTLMTTEANISVEAKVR